MKGFYQLSYPSQLLDQFVGRGGSLCLILVKHLVPEGGGFGVKGNSVAGGFEVVYRLEQHLGKAVNGADYFTGSGYG